MSSSAAPLMPFVAVKAVITQLCQNLSATASDNMAQLHEYTVCLFSELATLRRDTDFVFAEVS